MGTIVTIVLKIIVKIDGEFSDDCRRVLTVLRPWVIYTFTILSILGCTLIPSTENAVVLWAAPKLIDTETAAGLCELPKKLVDYVNVQLSGAVEDNRN